MDDKGRIKVLERRLEMTNRYWLRAAKAAIDGDNKELRNRVALFEADPVEVILSR